MFKGTWNQYTWHGRLTAEQFASIDKALSSQSEYENALLFTHVNWNPFDEGCPGTVKYYAKSYPGTFMITKEAEGELEQFKFLLTKSE